MTLEHFVQAVGVAISLVGAFIVSPPGTIRAFKVVVSTSRSAAIGVGRYLGFLPPSAPVNVRLSGSSISVNLDLSGRLSIIDSAAGTLEEQVARIRSRVGTLQDEIGAEINDRRAGDAELRARLEELAGQLTASVSALTTRLDEEVARNEQTDSRALPVVGLGIVVSGPRRWSADFLPWPGCWWSAVS